MAGGPCSGGPSANLPNRLYYHALSGLVPQPLRFHVQNRLYCETLLGLVPQPLRFHAQNRLYYHALCGLVPQPLRVHPVNRCAFSLLDRLYYHALSGLISKSLRVTLRTVALSNYRTDFRTMLSLVSFQNRRLFSWSHPCIFALSRSELTLLPCPPGSHPPTVARLPCEPLRFQPTKST